MNAELKAKKTTPNAAGLILQVCEESENTTFFFTQHKPLVILVKMDSVSSHGNVANKSTGTRSGRAGSGSRLSSLYRHHGRGEGTWRILMKEATTFWTLDCIAATVLLLPATSFNIEFAFDDNNDKDYDGICLYPLWTRAREGERKGEKERQQSIAALHLSCVFLSCLRHFTDENI